MATSYTVMVLPAIMYCASLSISYALTYLNTKRGYSDLALAEYAATEITTQVCQTTYILQWGPR